MRRFEHLELDSLLLNWQARLAFEKRWNFDILHGQPACEKGRWQWMTTVDQTATTEALISPSKTAR